MVHDKHYCMSLVRLKVSYALMEKTNEYKISLVKAKK